MQCIQYKYMYLPTTVKQPPKNRMSLTDYSSKHLLQTLDAKTAQGKMHWSISQTSGKVQSF